MEHLNYYKTILKDLVHIENFKLKLFKIGDDEGSTNTFVKVAEHIRSNMDVNIDIALDMTRLENQYYKGLQFKIYI